MTTFQLDDYPLWTALITPFNQAGEIDYDSLAKIANAQAESGNGILLCGSTGEGLAIEFEQQLQIVEFVCQQQLPVPLMVAVGGLNLPQQLAWIERCNSLPIHSYLLTSPLYTKPGVVGQTQWFERLLDTAAHPCMLYNVPSRTGANIPAQTVANLANHQNFWAMKEASGDINQFLRYVEAAPQVKMYSGEDGLLPYLVSAGAVGLVSVCANAWPKASHLYVRQSVAGKGQALFPTWYKAVESLFEVANPIPVKLLMHHQGVISSPVLRPPLTHLELANVDNLVAADAAITQWLAQQKSA
ncbi:4-hydroxy-tetrahydrodipicolinate synthase [Thalassotalea ponticola]|uniref:4-hydroxy-tetrahydrodipicolinate synthase n=1 Tax=Thalassotalea ponticola TaxID=1523392 RepID=UPI0025B59B62|nr:4-hydroxy-tetrahydrodipicolinate synthase [Thalassotalea ponticola]MDN3653368.1 4-hydroxy-tetrahydrodipicolinate synthase [Thalassotalea ponticola]